MSPGVTPWHFQPDLHTGQAHSPDQRVTTGRETQDVFSVCGNHLQMTFREGCRDMGGALTHRIPILELSPHSHLSSLSRVVGLSCPGKDLVFFGQMGSKKSSKSRTPSPGSLMDIVWMPGPLSSPPVYILPHREHGEAHLCSLSGRAFQLSECPTAAAFPGLLTPCRSFKYLWTVRQALCGGLWESKED